jgi:hypothetical protein
MIVGSVVCGRVVKVSVVTASTSDGAFLFLIIIEISCRHWLACWTLLYKDLVDIPALRVGTLSPTLYNDYTQQTNTKPKTHHKPSTHIKVCNNSHTRFLKNSPKHSDSSITAKCLTPTPPTLPPATAPPPQNPPSTTIPSSSST